MERFRWAFVCGVILFICFSLNLPGVVRSKQAAAPPYKDPSLPIEKRVDDLVSRMSLEEKVSQMMNTARPIERLDIPEYEWWNEGLHGVARAGYATVFPIAMITKIVLAQIVLQSGGGP